MATSLPSGRWQDLTTTDFARVDPARTIALLPVAAIEQHGPHLPLSTDAVINEGVVNEMLRRLPASASVLVLPEGTRSPPGRVWSVVSLSVALRAIARGARPAARLARLVSRGGPGTTETGLLQST